jgi:predicted nuclease of predicted toxin-antitoxin system
MRIVIDMNLTQRWVQYLCAAGHDVVHWASIGAVSASDQDIFDYARLNDYVLLTNDLDFPRILAHTKQAKPSVVLLRGEPLIPESRGFALLQALTDCEAELSQGAILSLDWSDKPRARILPLR